TIKSAVNGTDDTHVAKPETVNLKISSDGHIVSVNGTALTSGALPDLTGMGNGLISAVLPSGDVRVGDTWSKTYDSKPPTGCGSRQREDALDRQYSRDAEPEHGLAEQRGRIQRSRHLQGHAGRGDRSCLRRPTSAWRWRPSAGRSRHSSSASYRTRKRLWAGP